ncbi:MAG: TIR domain-containing protein [Coriobacteriia bacterium]|nr:TIR domain-containing protein [Coriobacteriia bacterium]
MKWKRVIMADNNQMKIFLSYGREDENSIINEALLNYLKKYKSKETKNKVFKVWIDKEKIKTGDDWRSKIVSGISESDRIVACLSKHSVRNPGVCRTELELSLCFREPNNVKTILLEDENDVQAPAAISQNQWLDMSDWKNNYNKDTNTFNKKWFKKKMKQLTKALKNPRDKIFQGEISALYSYLNPPTYSKRPLSLVRNINDNNDIYIERKWLIEKINNWFENPNSNQVFCLYGSQGTGKSTFAAHLMFQTYYIVAGIFFEFNDKKLCRKKNIIITLAYQLATKIPEYREALYRKLKDMNPSFDSKDNNTNFFKDFEFHDGDEYNLFRELITDLLPAEFGNHHKYVILLDALDEAYQNDKEIVEFLYENFKNFPSWMKFIITSRPEYRITKQFGTMQKLELDSKKK